MSGRNPKPKGINDYPNCRGVAMPETFEKNMKKVADDASISDKLCIFVDDYSPLCGLRVVTI
ncbi:MAG: hypothetical protein IJB56_08625 [Alistipes sp.]|nr:hypothetical protein [Alistipes sp.]